MPSKKQYNLVQSDDLDSRVPLITEEAFQHGINFNVKMIGSMDIPRPMSRVEIVAAMRRVRVEFKTKGVKKRKVTLSVSVDGVKTSLRKRKKKRRQNYGGVDEMVIKQHPIYRIFYVSHDSQDVKIFSYIARETSSNTFHCCVFKASKKKQALRIVRTVGQAFEVCHKLNYLAGDGDDTEPTSVTEELVKEEPAKYKREQQQQKVNSSSLTNKTSARHTQGIVAGNDDEDGNEESIVSSNRSAKQRPPPLVDTWRDSISAQHETQLLKEKLEQQSMSTQAAVAQINLLRDQLAAEAAARVEAQNRTQQLLLHNKELLDHLQTLVQHIQELEGTESPNLPQVPPATPTSPSQQYTSFQEIEALRRQNAALLETILYENNRLYYQSSPSPIRLTLSPALSPTYIYPYQGLVVGNSHLPTPQSSPRSTSDEYGRPSPCADSFLAAARAAAAAARQATPPSGDEREQRDHRYYTPDTHEPNRLQPPKLGTIGRKTSAEEFGSQSSSKSLSRSVSEKIGHKSDLMSQVQRTAWARHTTK